MLVRHCQEDAHDQPDRHKGRENAPHGANGRPK